MKICHALDKLQPSIFLAGPTPRDHRATTWRKEAIGVLSNWGFEGTIYIPEDKAWATHGNYDAQIKWELEALNQATRVAFWIPRELEHMPAFTSNVEYGMLISSGKCLLGYPVDAPKMRYLHNLAEKFHTPVFHTIKELLETAAWEAEETIRLCNP